MIYVNLRSGNFGCGVVGDNLVKALGALSPVYRLDRGPRLREPLPGPLLERLDKIARTYTARRHVAYSVFEADIYMRQHGAAAGDLFDVIAPASHWCERVLLDAGLTNVTTIHQGVDCSVFNPMNEPRQKWRERFIVFSGGKFELRKSQDVVVQAFRIFAERHADAMLVAGWLQPWTKHAATMARSPYLPYDSSRSADQKESLTWWLWNAGIRPEQYELLDPLPHRNMADIYRNTDVGLFPSRCEGGTNLVLMEYMACGRPVIATDFSGHRDVLTTSNSFPLTASHPLPVTHDGQTIACWCEPDVDEIVASLTRVYDDRSAADAIARHGSNDMKTWTWERSAHGFLKLLEAS